VKPHTEGPTSTLWSTGRYDTVGDRVAPITAQVVDAADHQLPLPDAALVDFACGTGSAAPAAAARGAAVTGVDITPELSNRSISATCRPEATKMMPMFDARLEFVAEQPSVGARAR
jgi:predicted RNA methylase